MSEVGEKKTFLSDFNEAGFQMKRLNDLWLSSNYNSSKGYLIKWKWDLDTIWRELYADAKKKTSDKKCFLTLKLLNVKIALAKNDVALYNALNGKHLFLKNLQESVGKGGKQSEQWEDDLM